jgi:hypothetical protein
MRGIDIGALQEKNTSAEYGKKHQQSQMEIFKQIQKLTKKFNLAPK